MNSAKQKETLKNLNIALDIFLDNLPLTRTQEPEPGQNYIWAFSTPFAILTPEQQPTWNE